MREEVRKELVDVLQHEMLINPELVARDGANSDGFYVFAGLKFNSAEKLRAFVTWTTEQQYVISQNQELFNEWFREGE